MNTLEFAKKPMPPDHMPKRVSRIKVHEISSVDRGAGEGCEVVLSKSDHDETASKVERGLRALKMSVESIAEDETLGDPEAALSETFAQASDWFGKLFPGDDVGTDDEMTASPIADTDKEANTVPTTKGEIYALINERAQASRAENQSASQAFAKFVTTDLEGRRLYDCLKRAKHGEAPSEPAEGSQGARTGVWGFLREAHGQGRRAAQGRAQAL
jgi:hypothetical protein